MSAEEWVRRDVWGRVERRNAVFQDRLVKQMRLRGISDMAQAKVLGAGDMIEPAARGSAKGQQACSAGRVLYNPPLRTPQELACDM